MADSTQPRPAPQSSADPQPARSVLLERGLSDRDVARCLGLRVRADFRWRLSLLLTRPVVSLFRADTWWR